MHAAARSPTTPAAAPAAQPAESTTRRADRALQVQGGRSPDGRSTLTQAEHRGLFGRVRIRTQGERAVWTRAFWERRSTHGVVAACDYADRRMRAECRGEWRLLPATERQLGLFSEGS